MIQPQKIIIADDHPLFRQALLEMLQAKLTQTQWFQAQTIEALEQRLTENSDSDLVLLDLHIPEAHGFNTLIHIRSRYPHIPVVIISAFEDNDTISKAMECGAAGFIPKSTPVDYIFEAITQILLGNIWLPETFNSAIVCKKITGITEQVASLTQQQHRILMMFAQGLLNKQIAYELKVSEATIKAHATAIFKKLNVRNRTQAVIALGSLEIPHTYIE